VAVRIGQLAKAAGTKVSAVRYYERVGLMAPTSRTRGGYREYDEDALRRIALIRRAKEVGFSLREVGALLGKNGRPAHETGKLRDLIDTKLAALRDKRASLHAVERDLIALRVRIASSEQSRELAFEALSHAFTTTDVAPPVVGVPGWFLAGSRPQSYEIGIADETHADRSVAYLRCTGEPGDGFGTLMQMIASDDFVGSRLQFSAFVRTENVSQAGLWLRIDGQMGQQLAFDNMQTRPIRGTTAWERHTVVLDVDTTARKIAFGVILVGVGDLRIADCRFERVAADVPITAPSAPTRPRSLDFSERDAIQNG
jgi:DNA-binding transcriptional MerR regulator